VKEGEIQKQKSLEITGNYGNTSHTIENIISGNYRKLPEITSNFPPWVLGRGVGGWLAGAREGEGRCGGAGK
jgi:hypothetical protein